MLPALIIAVFKLTSRGTNVPVVGAGAIAELQAEDAPQGLRFALEVRRREPVAETALRVENVISGWPDVIVIGLDASGVESASGSLAYRATFTRLARQAEGALAVPVLIAPSVPAGASESLRAAVLNTHEWWRLDLCRTQGSRVCVDLTPDSAPAAPVVAGVREALARVAHWKASTQLGR